MSGKFHSQLTRVAHGAYALAAALAAMALWGWALDVAWLRDLGADFAPMSAPAALAFVLLAAGFVAAERGRQRMALATSMLVALVAGAALVEALFVLRFDIAAPLLGFSAPGAIAAMLAAIAIAAARPTPWLLDTLYGRRIAAVV